LETSSSTVAKAWREVGVAPWRVETFKFSIDQQLSRRSPTSVATYSVTVQDDQIFVEV
jgi:hypothetical protein